MNTAAEQGIIQRLMMKMRRYWYLPESPALLISSWNTLLLLIMKDQVITWAFESCHLQLYKSLYQYHNFTYSAVAYDLAITLMNTTELITKITSLIRLSMKLIIDKYAQYNTNHVEKTSNKLISKMGSRYSASTNSNSNQQARVLIRKWDSERPSHRDLNMMLCKRYLNLHAGHQFVQQYDKRHLVQSRNNLLRVESVKRHALISFIDQSDKPIIIKQMQLASQLNKHFTLIPTDHYDYQKKGCFRYDKPPSEREHQQERMFKIRTALSAYEQYRQNVKETVRLSHQLFKISQIKHALKILYRLVQLDRNRNEQYLKELAVQYETLGFKFVPAMITQLVASCDQLTELRKFEILGRKVKSCLGVQIDIVCEYFIELFELHVPSLMDNPPQYTRVNLQVDLQHASLGQAARIYCYHWRDYETALSYCKKIYYRTAEYGEIISPFHLELTCCYHLKNQKEIEQALKYIKQEKELQPWFILGGTVMRNYPFTSQGIEKGIEMKAKGHIMAAIEIFKDYDANEDRGYCMIELANCYEQIRQYEEAEELYYKVGAMTFNLNCQLPMFYERRGRLNQAIIAYRLIISLGHDNNCFACCKLSHIYKQQGKISQALSVLQKGFKFSPDNPMLNRAMGDLLKGCRQKAKERVLHYRNCLDGWYRLKFVNLKQFQKMQNVAYPIHDRCIPLPMM